MRVFRVSPLIHDHQLLSAFQLISIQKLKSSHVPLTLTDCPNYFVSSLYPLWMMMITGWLSFFRCCGQSLEINRPVRHLIKSTFNCNPPSECLHLERVIVWTELPATAAALSPFANEGIPRTLPLSFPLQTFIVNRSWATLLSLHRSQSTRNLVASPLTFDVSFIGIPFRDFNRLDPHNWSSSLVDTIF